MKGSSEQFWLCIAKSDLMVAVNFIHNSSFQPMGKAGDSVYTEIMQLFSDYCFYSCHRIME